ncbi:hypothetical protein POVWA2_079560 [Plasmodium ovale wallikeri]|uniref:Uncharacterized protein n=2 Tax=Plasmodium ovale TaxID=36330 RepID=A0A1A9AN52_PLAOA|nr:hypothetical protein POVWA2_079560 [Plasmodium ovale wallikeri]SBT57634.1 hypothetical protein POVWA1_082810 [Plasmodium ovale wallikeri]SBT72976.1 hypothetical protein POWCR01_000065400 [Plasmodium ovale]
MNERKFYNLIHFRAYGKNTMNGENDKGNSFESCRNGDYRNIPGTWQGEKKGIMEQEIKGRSEDGPTRQGELRTA